ncbi:hypothetical protein [Paenibacillus sp. y28]|uniref:hypothetical protein n=1 Tax=Paenibacillus sp. y28 TaxID=3129110 RepID=UPI00301799EA
MNQKFVFFDDSECIGEFIDYAEKFVYIQQDFEKFSRLVIWPNDQAIEVLKVLLQSSTAPYAMFYILRSSRCNHEEARYKMEGLSFNELQVFLESFQTFLEYDSRHRLVIRSSDEKLTYFLFDEDNFILAYGNVDAFKALLHPLGFEEYDKPLIQPDPHMHMFHEGLDENEHKILTYFPWKKSPLQEIDR